MRRLALLLLIAPMAWAQERPLEVDANTKIQGGADVPASAGSAGAGARTDNRMESEPRVEQRGEVAGPDRARIDHCLTSGATIMVAEVATCPSTSATVSNFQMPRMARSSVAFSTSLSPGTTGRLNRALSIPTK